MSSRKIASSCFTNDTPHVTLLATHQSWMRKGRDLVKVMVFNATFNTISAISWRWVLLVDETGVPGRKSLTIFISICCIEYISPWAGFELTTLVAICTDCTGSCKSTASPVTTTNGRIVWRYQRGNQNS